MRAVGLRSAVAILIAVTGVSLAVGSENAETAALAEPEVPDGTDSGAGDAAPTAGRAEQRRERREIRAKRGEEWLAHARVVLFDGIELSAEQSRGVGALFEAELTYGRRTLELRDELEAARRRGDMERIRAINAERAALRERRKGPNKTMEELRVLLTEEQRPVFDLNRARLAAESQQAQRGRRRGPRAGAAVEAE